MKYLGINLMKYMQDLYDGNYKTIREINRYDYELYDLLESYFIRKNYPI